MSFSKQLLLISLVFLGAFSSTAAGPEEDLPPLMEATPSRPYEVLTPVGAGKKDMAAARQQLRREAAKAQAEAVVSVRCEPGGMARQGLTWFHKDAYCRGLAIRYSEGPESQPSAERKSPQ